MEHIFFDLDGTLIDSKKGIINCFHYATSSLRLKPIDDVAIQTLIGLPMSKMLKTLLGTEDEDLWKEALSIYRQRYDTAGYLEFEIYVGIDNLINDLFNNGRKLYVVSGKLDDFCKKIVKAIGIEDCFAGIYGSDKEGKFSEKAELIEYIMGHHQIDPKKAVMIGDKNIDIFAAKSNNILSIGVTYGYGGRKELIDASADYIVDSPKSIRNIIMSL